MTSEPMACATTGENTPSLREFLLYFLRLGTFGFGGPIALAGYMQRDLVETRQWISPQDYKEGLALAQLSPGPLAAQLAMYLGWVRFGRLGSTLVAAAFILPSFVMVVILSALYLRYGGLPWMQAAFYGVGAAVIAIVARSAWKLAARDRRHTHGDHRPDRPRSADQDEESAGAGADPRRCHRRVRAAPLDRRWVS
jgi:chromate transporter